MKPPEIKPLAPERFKVQCTVSRDTYDKLRQAQDLLRHSIPTGDPAAIFDRALTLLLEDLLKPRFAATIVHELVGAEGSSAHDTCRPPSSAKCGAAMAARCAFRGEQGRCRETGFLEFHHVVPYCQGGATTTANLELRCRAITCTKRNGNR